MAEPNMKVELFMLVLQYSRVYFALHNAGPGSANLQYYEEALSVRSYLRQVHKRRIKILESALARKRYVDRLGAY